MADQNQEPIKAQATVRTYSENGEIIYVAKLPEREVVDNGENIKVKIVIPEAWQQLPSSPVERINQGLTDAWDAIVNSVSGLTSNVVAGVGAIAGGLGNLLRGSMSAALEAELAAAKQQRFDDIVNKEIFEPAPAVRQGFVYGEPPEDWGREDWQLWQQRGAYPPLAAADTGIFRSSWDMQLIDRQTFDAALQAQDGDTLEFSYTVNMVQGGGNSGSGNRPASWDDWMRVDQSNGDCFYIDRVTGQRITEQAFRRLYENRPTNPPNSVFEESLECRFCKGLGYIPQEPNASEICPDCDGTGRIEIPFLEQINLRRVDTSLDEQGNPLPNVVASNDYYLIDIPESYNIMPGDKYRVRLPDGTEIEADHTGKVLQVTQPDPLTAEEAIQDLWQRNGLLANDAQRQRLRQLFVAEQQRRQRAAFEGLGMSAAQAAAAVANLGDALRQQDEDRGQQKPDIMVLNALRKDITGRQLKSPKLEPKRRKPNR